MSNAVPTRRTLPNSGLPKLNPEGAKAAASKQPMATSWNKAKTLIERARPKIRAQSSKSNLRKLNRHRYQANSRRVEPRAMGRSLVFTRRWVWKWGESTHSRVARSNRDRGRKDAVIHAAASTNARKS